MITDVQLQAVWLDVRFAERPCKVSDMIGVNCSGQHCMTSAPQLQACICSSHKVFLNRKTSCFITCLNVVGIAATAAVTVGYMMYSILVKISCEMVSCNYHLAGIPAMCVLIYRQHYCVYGQHTIGMDCSGQACMIIVATPAVTVRFVICSVMYMFE